MREYQVAYVTPCRARLPAGVLWTMGQPPKVVHIAGEYREGIGGASISVGLRVVAFLEAEARQRAEERAREWTMMWTTLACFAAGVEVGGMPRLVATLERLDDEGRFAFTQFFYRLHDVPPTRLVPFEALSSLYDGLLAITDEDLNRRLALAIRWYTVGMGEIDSINRFLSYWVALEAIGPPLAKALHPHGQKASCPVCRNPLGESRDRRIAGMQHVLAAVSGDPGLQARLEEARNNIFHGLRHLDELDAQVNEGREYLPSAVAHGILTLLASSRTGKEYWAEGPMPLAEFPHARLDCTLIEPTEAHIKQALYGYLFKAEMRDVSATTQQDGDIAITAGVALSAPEDLRVANERFAVVPLSGLNVTSRGTWPASSESEP
jgi:hypothetical protein